MRIKQSLVVVILLYIFIAIPKVSAYTCSLSASKTTLNVGESITITATVQDVMGVYRVSSTNEAALVVGANNIVEVDDSSTHTNYITFTAKSVGTATITMLPFGQGLNVFSTEEPISSCNQITINVVKKYVPPAIDVNPTYNSNNYLKSLSIEGYELDKPFDKEQLEYNVTLDPGTEKINVSAVVEDSTAKTKGTGEVSVSEGINKIEIVVTAENGNERTYKIFATVDEKDPIEIEINNEKYRIVKNKDLIEIKDGYIETTVKIKNFDIPALYNEVTHVTLIGLKDKEGNIELFSYDASNGEYSEYKEFKFDLMQLYVKENPKSKYKKVNIKINDVDVVAYELEGIKDYYLLYATNTTTGYTGYYMYDVKENSVQRYNTIMLDKITKEKDKYLSTIIVLSSVCFLTMLFLLIEVNRDSKREEN